VRDVGRVAIHAVLAQELGGRAPLIVGEHGQVVGRGKLAEDEAQAQLA
jgi:hypothetical protein